jgi:protein gp37
MAEGTAIKWTGTVLPDGSVIQGNTFNPWIGCTMVSAGSAGVAGGGCAHCYAFSENERKKWNKNGWGPKAARSKTGTWGNPLKWEKQAILTGVRTKVFCASLSDVMDDHPSIQQEWRDELFALIRATPHLLWLLLTKRPENFSRFLPSDWGDGYPNVWLGTTTESGEMANLRLPILLRTPAVLRFVSIEPLLDADYMDNLDAVGRSALAEMDWLIVAGESDQTPKAGHKMKGRPLSPDAARAILQFSRDTGSSYFFKQWGTIDQYGNRVNNHAAALLDGVSYEEYPDPDRRRRIDTRPIPLQSFFPALSLHPGATMSSLGKLRETAATIRTQVRQAVLPSLMEVLGKVQKTGYPDATLPDLLAFLLDDVVEPAALPKAQPPAAALPAPAKPTVSKPKAKPAKAEVKAAAETEPKAEAALPAEAPKKAPRKPAKPAANAAPAIEDVKPAAPAKAETAKKAKAKPKAKKPAAAKASTTPTLRQIITSIARDSFAGAEVVTAVDIVNAVAKSHPEHKVAAVKKSFQGLNGEVFEKVGTIQGKYRVIPTSGAAAETTET